MPTPPTRRALPWIAGAALALCAQPALATVKLDGPDAVAAAVLVSNPDLAALEARIASLQHAVPQAGVWPDPMASVEYSNVPLDAPYPGGHMMSGVQFRFQQTIPFPGKTEARTAVAESRVTTAKDQLAERRNELSGIVRNLYHQLALTRQLRTITERHVALVGQLIGVVRARYETGAAPQHDLLQLMVLRQRLTDDLDQFTSRAREITAALLASVHLPQDTPIETPEVTPLPTAPSALYALVQRATRDRPILHELADHAQTARLSAQRAQRERSPDFTVWLGYRYRRAIGPDDGTDLYSAGISIPLPWLWNDRRWGEQAEEQRSLAQSFDEQRAARLDAIRGQLDGAWARWRRADEKARFYEEELLPAQRQTLQSALATYRVGRAEFATLYRAELELLDVERGSQTARNDAARARVEISTLTGAYADAKPGQR